MMGPVLLLAASDGSRAGSGRRIVVTTPDVLTPNMAGPAIRAWQICSALAAEHEVQLVTTSPVCEIASANFEVRIGTDETLRELETWTDLLIIQGFTLEDRPFLRSTSKVLVVDLYDPLHLEQLELFRYEAEHVRRVTVRRATAELNEQLARGDFFLCASSRQRDFWLGQLAAFGRINPSNYDRDGMLESLITTVPFGLPDAAPRHGRNVLKGVVPGIGPSDEVILWGGGIYNWFDPLTLVKAVDRLRRRRPQVRLFFMGLRHPNPEAAEMRMAVATRQLAEQLSLTGKHVFFNEGWVAYDDRQNYLLEADVGVSTHLDHLETAFSFRTRILDYIWAGLPIVATTGDAFAPIIEERGLGITVPAADVAALEAALFRMLEDRELAARCGRNMEAVRAHFSWDNVLRPLVEFCRSPSRAPDLVGRTRSRRGTGSVSWAPPWDLGRDARTLLRHLRDGGPGLALRKALSRLDRAIVGRR